MPMSEIGCYSEQHEETSCSSTASHPGCDSRRPVLHVHVGSQTDCRDVTAPVFPWAFFYSDTALKRKSGDAAIQFMPKAP